MKVLRGLSTNKNQQATTPFPEKDGIFFELRGGDVCDPIGGNWFKEPYPKLVLRFFVKWKLLPYFSYRIGNRAGYIGFKIYGVDSPEYKNWMKPEEVYDGSQAMCFSVRLAATIKERV